MTICPCKDCQDRTMLCHSICSKYIDWRKERDRLLEEQRKFNSTYPAKRGKWVFTIDRYWRKYDTDRRK